MSTGAVAAVAAAPPELVCHTQLLRLHSSPVLPSFVAKNVLLIDSYCLFVACYPNRNVICYKAIRCSDDTVVSPMNTLNSSLHIIFSEISVQSLCVYNRARGEFLALLADNTLLLLHITSREDRAFEELDDEEFFEDEADLPHISSYILQHFPLLESILDTTNIQFDEVSGTLSINTEGTILVFAQPRTPEPSAAENSDASVELGQEITMIDNGEEVKEGDSPTEEENNPNPLFSLVTIQKYDGNKIFLTTVSYASGSASG